MGRLSVYVLFFFSFGLLYTARGSDCEKFYALLGNRESREPLDRFLDTYQLTAQLVRPQDTLHIKRYFNIDETGDFVAMSSQEKQWVYAKMAENLAKVPSQMRNVLRQRGLPHILTKEHIAEHPAFAAMADQINKTDRAVPKRLYREITGISFNQGQIIGSEQSGSVILHEMGHGWDRRYESQWESSSPEFKRMADLTQWEDPYFNSDEEAFAEGFSRFFFDRYSRDELRKKQPLIHRYFSNKYAVGDKPQISMVRTLSELESAQIVHNLVYDLNTFDYYNPKEKSWYRYGHSTLRFSKLLFPTNDRVVPRNRLKGPAHEQLNGAAQDYFRRLRQKFGIAEE